MTRGDRLRLGRRAACWMSAGESRFGWAAICSHDSAARTPVRSRKRAPSRLANADALGVQRHLDRRQQRVDPGEHDDVGRAAAPAPMRCWTRSTVSVERIVDRRRSTSAPASVRWPGRLRICLGTRRWLCDSRFDGRGHHRRPGSGS